MLELFFWFKLNEMGFRGLREKDYPRYADKIPFSDKHLTWEFPWKKELTPHGNILVAP